MATQTHEIEINPETALPEGPRPLPYIGNLLAFQRNSLGYLQELQKTYGNMATIYAGRQPIVLLFRPEHVRYILTENPKNFTLREFSESLRELIGDGLLALDGETHRQQRRAVQPAFHKKRVESYAGVMTQYTEELLKEWRPGQQVDMSKAMQELTLRIVVKCLFNIDLATRVNEIGDAFSQIADNPGNAIETLVNLKIDQPFTSYGRRMDAKRKLDTFIYQLIAERRASGRDEGDMLSMLLEYQDEVEGLSDTQVRDHIMTFLAAGHETTALTLVWCFYLLSENPRTRAKLIDELKSVLGDRSPTLADLPKLQYLDWVISEAQRLYPPAWTQGRHAVESFELDGVTFPAGTMVMFSQWVIHRLPEIWRDPETFRPERWNPESAEKVPAWSYFPFGGGPRICIGMPFAQMEAKLLLATILQQYTPTAIEGYKLELNPLATLRPKYPLQVVLNSISGEISRQGYKSPIAFQEERKGCLYALLQLLPFGGF